MPLAPIESLDIVDCHHHFWDLSGKNHPWLCDPVPVHFRYGDYSSIKRNYFPADYRRDVAPYRVVKTVHEEAWWKDRKRIRATDCERCHTEETFELQAFDHHRTAFPLEGAHRAVACDRCHDFAVTKEHRFLLFHSGSRDCQSCHRSPHLRGMERCLECHTQSTWKVGF